MTTVHVVGAGLAGLAAALAVAKAGRKVVVYEAARRAGGRCRSFIDSTLGCLIDNGTHLLLSGNRATLAYLDEIGTRDALHVVRPARFPFLDLLTGERWALRPTPGPFPAWMFVANRRVPGTRLADYLGALRLARAPDGHTVADRVGCDTALFERLWQPLCAAALNTDAHEASARLMWAVLAETLARGEAASRPMVLARGLSPTLIDPAVARLGTLGAEIRYQARLRGLRLRDRQVTGLLFQEGMLRVADEDRVVLAVPPESCAELLAELDAPRESRAIVNVHYRMEGAVALPGGQPFVGLIGGEAQWLFARDNILSVTVSAADRLLDEPAWRLATRLWADCARALGRNVGRVPPWRVIKERRATLAQTPEALRRRPPSETAYANLFLAGDWTATGLPATIEGGIRSGRRAAALALRRR